MPTDQPTIEEILMAPGPFAVWSAVVFLLGLMIGSFLNVAIYRLPLGLSVNKPKRSFCFRCGTTIAPQDNIPVLSFFLLGGRGRWCGAPFSPRYAAVEFLTACVFLAIWLTSNRVGDFSLMSIWYLAFAGCLIVGSFTDVDHWIIPPSIPRWGTVGALLAALLAGFFDKGSMIALGGPFPAVRTITGDALDRIIAVLLGPAYLALDGSDVLWWEPFANAAIGAVFAPAMLYAVGLLGKVIFRKEAMGLGDVDLFAMIGATVGMLNGVMVLIVASFFGSAAGLIRLAVASMREDDSPLAAGALGKEELLAVSLNASPKVSSLDPEEAERTREFAEGLEMEFVDLDTIQVDHEALSGFPAELARKHSVFPLRVEADSVRLAVHDPFKTSFIAEVREVLGKDAEFAIGAESQLRDYCERYFGEQSIGEVESSDMQGDQLPLWMRYYEIASLLPAPKPTNHLPFIPWIAMGALVVVIFQDRLMTMLNNMFFPTY